VIRPRAKPCGSCPYRCDVPSGVWSPEEYAKLPRYDGDTGQQADRVFLCHTGDNTACAGWLGHADAGNLLAVRLGIAMGKLDPACATYKTKVPLFASGREAAEHGLREVDSPDSDAVDLIRKLERKK
jgi:hypothetical protein